MRRDPLLVLHDDLVRTIFLPVARFMTAVSKDYHRLLSPRLIHMDSVEFCRASVVALDGCTVHTGNVTLAVDDDGKVFAIKTTISDWPKQNTESEMYIYLSKARSAPDGTNATVYDRAPFRVFGKQSSAKHWVEYKYMNLFMQDLHTFGHLYARGILGTDEGVAFCIGPTEAPTFVGLPILVPFYKHDQIAVRCQFPPGVAVHDNPAPNNTPHAGFRVSV